MTGEFEQMNWHDNAIHGIRIVEGPDGCEGELILDIDFIIEWLQSEDKIFKFLLTPCNLSFHDVSDLVISIDYASSTAAIQPMMVHEIRREVFTYPNGFSTFAWVIEMNWPGKSFISFQSSGFTQVPRKAPIISSTQYLSPSDRAT